MTTAASWLFAVFAALQAANPTPPAASGQTYPPAFPRQNATKLLETDRIAVWDIVWPKGQPSPLHRHVFDQVGTYYQTGGRAITQVNGTKSQNTTPVGNISTTRKGTTHIEEGTTDPPLRAVFIEMKRDTPLDQNADRSTAPRPGAKQVHAEDRVTVWDFTWSAAGTPINAKYDRDTVLVWLTSATVRIKKDRGDAEVQTVKPGTFWYRAHGTVEIEELVSGSPRVIIFEFR